MINTHIKKKQQQQQEYYPKNGNHLLEKGQWGEEQITEYKDICMQMEYRLLKDYL